MDSQNLIYDQNDKWKTALNTLKCFKNQRNPYVCIKVIKLHMIETNLNVYTGM